VSVCEVGLYWSVGKSVDQASLRYRKDGAKIGWPETVAVDQLGTRAGRHAQQREIGHSDPEEFGRGNAGRLKIDGISAHGLAELLIFRNWLSFDLVIGILSNCQECSKYLYSGHGYRTGYQYNCFIFIVSCFIRFSEGILAYYWVLGECIERAQLILSRVEDQNVRKRKNEGGIIIEAEHRKKSRVDE
jgi:hypothetical protein